MKRNILLCMLSVMLCCSSTISAQQIVRPVVVEEATGTWCGFCPRGAVSMDYMSDKYGDDFVGIAVHNGENDPMVVDAYDAGLTKFPNFSGFPSAVVARTHLLDPKDIEQPFLDVAAIPATVELNAKATYDKVTRQLFVTATAVPSKNYVAPKFFIALIEDGVSGTSPGYAQANYYAGGNYGQMGGYEKLPNPVPADKMVYNHVARALIGGFNGIGQSIKSPWLANKPATYEYDKYTIPEAFNISKCHVVVGVLSNENKFLNVVKLPLEEALASKELNADLKVVISPNPVKDIAYIQVNNRHADELSIRVFNNLGLQVAAQNYGRLNGENSLPLLTADLAAGVYFVHINLGEERVVKQIAIVK